MTVADEYELSHRYQLDHGRVFLSGSQALARLPYEQLRVDRRAGLRTAAYVTGYPGSPLAGYDSDVRAAARLAEADGLELVFQAAMNEELAATAVMGSQLAATMATRRHDGVLGIWYGKAPGLDRATDALRHAVFAGTAPLGGALALVADDPNAKSSTLPSSGLPGLADLGMPVLDPGDVQEAIDLGRHAVAMSRASGMWVGIKVVEAVAGGTGSLEVGLDRIVPVLPEVEVDGRRWVPAPSGRLLTPDTLAMEREIHEVRLPLAVEYGVMNRLNEVAVGTADDWIGIVASGHTYRETVEALRVLGLRTHDQLRAAGIRLFRVGMPVPLDRRQVRDFAAGLREVVVVEDKGQHLEWRLKDLLSGVPDAPAVVGKRTVDGAPLFPAGGELDADIIAPVLRTRLESRVDDRLAPPPPAPRAHIPLSVNRTPFFCSGCPHNSSTKVPEGAIVGAGIGCHTMVLMMEPHRVGDIVGLTCMGNEGAQWFGMAPFVDDRHLIQNIGDGTLFHSGTLAIRAAVANGVNITYKVLYNGAVAMTGGQDPSGGLTVPALTRALLAEGVREVLVTTDEPGRYRPGDLPDGVRVWGRGRIVEAQEHLARVPGCTVLIHDQRCAAEKRRDRKRHRIETPKFRVVINERVCEGCGDCSDASNCLSVQPVDTPFGRKTRIDQPSCNLDLACLAGDCPSFMLVPTEAEAASASPATLSVGTPPAAPPPEVERRDECTIRLSGIGGTGVVTTSQIIGTAAMLQGFHVRGLDQTGLSQKAGPVVSDVRLSRVEPHASNKATDASVDVLVAFDRLVASTDTTLRTLDAQRSVVVANTATVPTGSMVVHPERPYPAAEVEHRLAEGSARRVEVDATRLVTALLGDDSTVNVFMTGVAVQLGHVPVEPELLERAIELNGVAVEKNRAAFRWGRAWAADPAAVEQVAHPTPAAPSEPLVERLAADLADYQDQRYARRFRDVVATIEALGEPALTESVARNLHKLMAYKDEYEVARLLLAGSPKRATFVLHPPLLRSMGIDRKLHFAPWTRPAFRVLRAMRRVRGHWFDPVGFAHVRRVERQLVQQYVAALEHVVAEWSPRSLDDALAIASLPDRVRGYERLKLERVAAFREELSVRVDAFRP